MPNDTALFLGQFLRNPAAIGALAPSSRRLAAAVCAPVPERASRSSSSSGRAPARSPRRSSSG
ncbi:hypothetical protein ACFQQB_53680 [Nonomuraea rubra]|uniref:hypothetical protein n=1 Tax=Nonomuraea rubra TaxID=46180 RepID=UPI00361FDF82